MKKLLSIIVIFLLVVGIAHAIYHVNQGDGETIDFGDYHLPVDVGWPQYTSPVYLPPIYSPCECLSELKILKEAVSLLLEESIARRTPSQWRSRLLAIGCDIIYEPPMYYEIRTESGKWRWASRSECEELENKAVERADNQIKRMKVIANILRNDVPTKER